MKSPIMRASTEEILLHPACLVQASYVEATSIAQHAREQEGSPGVCNSLHAASVFLETSEVGMWLFAQRPWLNHFISGSPVTSMGAPAGGEWGGKADNAAFR